MKLLLPLFILVACTTSNEGKYKREYHVEDFVTSMAPDVAHGMLAQKMTKCYQQSDYPAYRKTVSEFDQVSQTGTISYETDTQSMGPRSLVLVEVSKDSAGSIVKVYSKGDLFRAPTVYSHQIHKWLDGKKVDCDSHGEI
jgi:hypothetical protein